MRSLWLVRLCGAIVVFAGLIVFASAALTAFGVETMP
jgi:hypothetical protein